MAYYTENFLGNAGQTARADHVTSELQAIQTGFEAVETAIGNGVRFDQAVDEVPFVANRFLRTTATGVELVQSGFAWRGDWTDATAYTVGDVVRSGAYGSLYVCDIAHTSSGSINLTNFSVLIDLTGLNVISNELKTASFTAVAGGDYMVDSSAGNVTITLPASPSISDAPINITHVGGTLATGQAITVARNGKLIMGAASDLTFDAENASISLMFCNDAKGWRLRVLA